MEFYFYYLQPSREVNDLLVIEDSAWSSGLSSTAKAWE